MYLNDVQPNQITLLHARIKELEDTLIKLEAIEERLAQVEPQGREFAVLRDRLEKLESLIMHEAAETFAEGADIRYHQVKAGETLYGISRRYGLTVDELRQVNRLAPGAVIYPDQELIVSATTE